MKAKKDIPPGYQLHITSWENDGDARATEILNGLSKADVAFYVELLSYFRSGSGFGNSSETDQREVAEVISKTLKSNPGVSTKITESFGSVDKLLAETDEYDEENADAISDTCTELMCDLLGAPVEQYYDYRVFETFKVYYFQSAVADVSEEFSKEPAK